MILNIPTCACGERMTVVNGKGDLFGCPNCDTVQERERAEKLRMPTVQDRRFNLAWTRQMREFYPEQFNKGGKAA